MSETTTAAANTASKKAAQAAATAVETTLPTVVETVELAAQIPSKVVFNQKLVVLATLVVGGGLGAGALYGVQKLKERRAAKAVEKDLTAEAEALIKAEKNKNA